MITKPKAFSAFVEWNFHLRHRNALSYQSGASLFSPIEHVLPYLKNIFEIMAGRDLVPYTEVVGKKVDTVPACGGIPCTPIVTHRHNLNSFGVALDFSDAMRLWWAELRTSASIENEAKSWANPASGNIAYRWNVWYSGGEPLALSFTMLDRKGAVEPLFDVPRSSVEDFVEMMTAPEAVTSLFSL